MYRQLKMLRDIQSILLTINTHSYDVIIQIHHRPRSLQDWGGPTEAIAVEGANVMNKTEGYHLKIWKFAALLMYNAYPPLINWKCVIWSSINLRCTPQGCQPLTKKFYLASEFLVRSAKSWAAFFSWFVTSVLTVMFPVAFPHHWNTFGFITSVKKI